MLGHVVCFPTTAPSHIGAMLKLAKLLHHRGFHISFINTESNHRRILQARSSSTDTQEEEEEEDGFQFLSIPDVGVQSPSLSVRIEYVRHGMQAPLLHLLNNLNNKCMTVPPVSCIVSDAYMTFSAGPVAQKLGIPLVHLWTIAASALMGFMHLPKLSQDQSTSEASLDRFLDWVPGMQNARFRDIPSFIRTTEGDELIFNLTMDALDRAHHASATIIHTAEALEPEIINALSAMFSHPLYAIAPFHLLLDQIPQQNNHHLSGNLWKEDNECLQWLNSKPPCSVLYVNFGSVLFLTQQQLTEFAMGISNSNQPFLWIIRSDIVRGDAVVLPTAFVEGTKGRGVTTSWCSQEDVLKHPAIGGFLSHCGWNSTLESLSAGVPMLCWPCSGDQFIDCRFVCVEWEIGLEVERHVNRENVERQIRELMMNKGGRLKKKAMEWRMILQEQTTVHGSSSINLERFINQIRNK